MPCLVEFEVSGTEEILRVSSLRPLMPWLIVFHLNVYFPISTFSDRHLLIILFCIFARDVGLRGHICIRRAWDGMRFRLALKIRLSVTVILARYI
jgi:hypothetical protein